MHLRKITPLSTTVYLKKMGPEKYSVFKHNNVRNYQKLSRCTMAHAITSRSPPPDLPSLLLSQRIVYLGSPLSSQVAELAIGELLWLNYESEKPLYLYINSIGSQKPDGEVVASDSETYAILDTLSYVRPAHYTLCTGQAFGNALVLLSSGERGMRAALQNARLKTCPARMNRTFARAVDQMIRAKEFYTANEIYLETLAMLTQKEKTHIRKVISRDQYWTPEDAIDFGFIDKVVGKVVRHRLNGQIV